MSNHSSRRDGNGNDSTSLSSSAHDKGGGHGGSSSYDVFEDQDSQHKVLILRFSLFLEAFRLLRKFYCLNSFLS